MTESLTLAGDVVAAARKAGADAADVLFYASTSLSVSQRLGKPEGIERAESGGIGLRVFVGQRSATVSSSDMGKEALEEMVTRAVAMAKLAPDDPYATLAPRELLAKFIYDLDLYDANEPDAKWLEEQCKIAEDAALTTPGITNSEGADAAYSATHFHLATSAGFAGSYRSSRASLSVSVLAGEGTSMERDYDYSSARFIKALEAPHTIGKNAAKRALARLNPRKMSTCQVPIVFDPRIGKSLLSGAFAGAINGSAIARGTSFLKNAMGTQLFANHIHIVDDPHRKQGLGSHPFDGEGVAGGKLSLVENGVLKSWLLDVRSANKLGLTTTGHGSRGLSSAPSPHPSNIYIEPGVITPQELLEDIKSGFYVTEVFGMGLNLVTGDYSQGASGFWIENGQKAYAVSEVTIAGKLTDMFARLHVANDLEFRYEASTPTLRIDGMTVAGK